MHTWKELYFVRLKSFNTLLLEKYWLILSGLGIVIFTLEFFEHENNPPLVNLIHPSEFLIFGILLLFLLYLIKQFKRALAEKEQVAQILDIKHQLSQELIAAQEWEEVLERILRFLPSIAPISLAMIEMKNRETNRLETIVERNYSGGPERISFSSSCLTCQIINNHSTGIVRSLRSCSRFDQGSTPSNTNGFCLPLFYSGSLVAVLDFLLPPGVALTPEQTVKYNSIAGDIAFALENAHQRRSLAEMLSNKAIMEERLRIFRDLHDNLGQTLAYMCVKLSQLTQDGSLLQETQFSSELSNLCSVANSAYGQVRSTLATMRAENVGQLMNLLVERTKMVEERMKIKVDFSTTGQSRLLSPATIRQILYIFREALANVERHAQAQHVDVQLDWRENEFILRIADDGCGFDPEAIHEDQHFGLSIMKERAEKIDGQLILNTHPEKGTEILVHVPLSVRQLAAV